jgi:hypothetical protein
LPAQVTAQGRSPGGGSETIEDVIARMRALDSELPEADGVAWFNKLYLAVTEAVLEAVEAGTFRKSGFLERLDVVFAGLYFEAVEASEGDLRSSPKAWAPLFDGRGRRDVAPIQFALCGMNAHINHDLPLALVTTASELGSELERGTAEHRDFEAVNAILRDTEERVKHWFATGFVAVIDEAFGRLDDVLAIWSVERARDQAWTAGETIEALAGAPPLRERYLLALARMVGFAGRGLLIPTAAPP